MGIQCCDAIDPDADLVKDGAALEWSVLGSYGGPLGSVSKAELVLGAARNFNLHLCFLCRGGFGGVRDLAAMEPDDIRVVMTRASELHANICDAIERVNKSRHSGKWLLHSFGDDGEEYDDEDAEARGNSQEDEMRSLKGIREALVALETQLKSLQSVQQQQRIRKDAVLAKLEESRRVLLQRLKEHDGREMQVVEEAMTFAGEPVKKTDDLPLPPYLNPISPSVYSESPVFRSMKAEKPNLFKQLDDRLYLNDSLFLVDEAVSDSEAAKVERGSEMPTDVGGDLAIEGGPEKVTANGAEVHIDEETSPSSSGFSRLFSDMFSCTRKTLLVVVSAVAFLLVSELNLKSPSGRKSQKPGETEPKPPSMSQWQEPAQTPPSKVEPRSDPKVELRPKPMPIFECPAGYKRIEDDGIVKCVVKERVELPFPRDIKTPDVLHGRG